jgi:hypothetical protein
MNELHALGNSLTARRRSEPPDQILMPESR